MHNIDFYLPYMCRAFGLKKVLELSQVLKSVTLGRIESALSEDAISHFIKDGSLESLEAELFD